MKTWFCLLLVTHLAKVWAQAGGGGGGQCVWYGQCGTNPSSGQQANCPYNGTAQPLDEGSVAVLTNNCPELVKDLRSGGGGGDLMTCCDGDQISSMSAQLMLGTSLLDRCPTCVRNFRLAFCYMTCSPVQSQFMVAQTTQVAQDTNKTIITTLEAHLTEHFVDGVYESCRDVSMPSSNSKVMSLMCGKWGTLYCNGPRLFTFMGSNPLAPFKVNYVFQERPGSTFTPFEKEVVACDLPATNTSQACSCLDCPASCPRPAPLPPRPSQ